MTNSKGNYTSFWLFTFLICLLVCFWLKGIQSNRTQDFSIKKELLNTNQSISPSPVGMASIHDARKKIELHRKAQAEDAKRILAEQETEEAENLRMKQWKENFPYKPTYHPTLKYDPNRYDPRNPSTFSGNPEMEMAVKNHGYMVAFYNNPQIYSAEFEQLYHMLEEIDRAENPIITGDIFANLKSYHQCRQKDQLALWAKTEYVLPKGNSPHGKRKIPVQVPIDGKTTWGERAEKFRSAIVGLLVRPKYWPEKELLDANVARAFRNRLIEAIPPDNLIKMQPIVHLPNGELGTFGYYYDAMLELKPGDKLLYK